MSNIVINDSDKFETIISNFRNTVTDIDNIFINENINFGAIEESSTWEGELQQSIVDKYNELSISYDTIIESLNGFADFMQDTLTAYKALENSLDHSLDDNGENLTVNS